MLNLNWLFPEPKRCVFCSRPATRFAHHDSAAVQICTECSGEIGWIAAPRCERCGRQLDKLSTVVRQDMFCRDCVRPPHSTGSEMLVKNRAVVAYTPLAQNIVGLFKYRGRETLAHPCGKLMAALVRREYRDESISAVTYVPLHTKREAERGFNQAELLANVIGRELQRPVYRCLSRVKETPKQSKQTRSDRITGMEGVFSVHFPQKRNFYRQGTFLIVDDVYTTGTTLRVCARELKRAGVSRILAVTFAR